MREGFVGEPSFSQSEMGKGKMPACPGKVGKREKGDGWQFE
jgi:hypothetical protein